MKNKIGLCFVIVLFLVVVTLATNTQITGYHSFKGDSSDSMGNGTIASRDLPTFGPAIQSTLSTGSNR